MSKQIGYILLGFLMIPFVAIMSKNFDQGTDDEEKIYDVADQEPLFPGGKEALVSFFVDNISFPTFADNNHIDGVVNFMFVVEKNGSISDVKVSSSKVITYNDSANGDNESIHTCNQLFTEAVKSAFKKMPQWQPARKDEQLVRFRKYLKVTFGQAKDDAPLPHAIQVHISGSHSFENKYLDDKKPFKDMHLYLVGNDYFVSGINRNLFAVTEPEMEFLKKKAKAVSNDIIKMKEVTENPRLLADFTTNTGSFGVSRPLFKGAENGLDEYMKSHLSTSFEKIFVKATFIVETDGTISCPVVEEGNDLKAIKMVIRKLRKTKK